MIHVSMDGAARALVSLFTTVSAALVVGACDPAGLEPPPGPMDVDTYVSVMSELIHLDRFPPPGSDRVTREARADSMRREILDRYGVTTDEMLTYAETAGEQPALMLEISDRIVAITDSLARLRRTGADTARSGPVGDTIAVDTAAEAGAAAPGLVPTDTVRRPRPVRELGDPRERRPTRTPTPTPPRTPTPTP